MTRKTASMLVACLIALLVVLQALDYLDTAYVIASLFHGAQNVRSSDSLPEIFWQYVALGLLWLAIGVIYFLNPRRVRRWSLLPAALAFVYGLLSYGRSAPALLSWFGAFHGDLIALETLSAVILSVLGLAGIVHWILERGTPSRALDL
jgi:hypothetical protein